MKHLSRALVVVCPLLIQVGLAPSPALADFSGFGDFSSFVVNQSDTGSPPTLSPNTIQMTSGPNQFRSIFHRVPQAVGAFTASFSYRAESRVRNMGVTFVLQNDPAGLGALGSGFASFGYSGIQSSIGVTLEGEVSPNAPTHSGIFSGGVLGGGALPTTPVDLSSGHWINVTLSYNGSVLSESLVDTVTGATFNSAVFFNIPALVGGSTAYVGIAAASGDNGVSPKIEYVSDLRFGTVPQPASLVMLGLAALPGLRRARRLNV